MQLYPGIKVFSRERKLLGRVQYLLINQNNYELHGLVVQSRRRLVNIKETIVAFDLWSASFFSEAAIGSGQLDEVQLELSASQFEALPLYREYQGETNLPDLYVGWLACNHEGFLIYPDPETYAGLEKVRNCEPDILQFGRAVEVRLNDGAVGRVYKFYFGGIISHSGPVLSSLKAQFDFLGQAVNIPAAWIKSIKEEQVFLDLTLPELISQLDWETIPNQRLSVRLNSCK